MSNPIEQTKAALSLNFKPLNTVLASKVLLSNIEHECQYNLIVKLRTQCKLEHSLSTFYSSLFPYLYKLCLVNVVNRDKGGIKMVHTVVLSLGPGDIFCHPLLIGVHHPVTVSPVVRM